MKRNNNLFMIFSYRNVIYPFAKNGTGIMMTILRMTRIHYAVDGFFNQYIDN